MRVDSLILNSFYFRHLPSPILLPFWLRPLEYGETELAWENIEGLILHNVCRWIGIVSTRIFHFLATFYCLHIFQISAYLLLDIVFGLLAYRFNIAPQIVETVLFVQFAMIQQLKGPLHYLNTLLVCMPITRTIVFKLINSAMVSISLHVYNTQRQDIDLSHLGHRYISETHYRKRLKSTNFFGITFVMR